MSSVGQQAHSTASGLQLCRCPRVTPGPILGCWVLGTWAASQILFRSIGDSGCTVQTWLSEYGVPAVLLYNATNLYLWVLWDLLLDACLLWCYGGIAAVYFCCLLLSVKVRVRT